MASRQLIRNRKIKEPMIFMREINRFSGPVMGKLGNVEKVGHKLAHHLAGIILIVVGKRKLFIVVKKLLAHIPPPYWRPSYVPDS